MVKNQQHNFKFTLLSGALVNGIDLARFGKMCIEWLSVVTKIKSVIVFITSAFMYCSGLSVRIFVRTFVMTKFGKSLFRSVYLSKHVIWDNIRSYRFYLPDYLP